jgi:hypothetical protein
MPLLKVNQIASYSGNTLTVGTTGDTVTLATGASSSGFGATYNSGLNWTSTLVTSALTVSSGTGYFVNTSTAAITVTLPASPTFGSIVGINDYSGYASTNNITINPNGNKLEGATSNKLVITDKESIILNYVDSTRGWLSTSGVNNGTDALTPIVYSVDFLVVAGGGGGGGNKGGGGGGGGYRTSTQSVNQGIVYTITVGDGGAGGISGTGNGTNGSNSSISGSGITTITSAGGGGGATDISNSAANGNSGGSGGGGARGGSAGSGNTPSVSPSQGNSGGSGSASGGLNGGGGGGASASGGAGGGSAGNGGSGTSSSITGSSVTYAGGGGGQGYTPLGGNSGSGGSGGGGNGQQGTGGSGTANLGGGGGGSEGTLGGDGGKGVVILSMLTTKYSGTTTGSPTVTTSGSNTILKFTGSGSYTA